MKTLLKLTPALFLAAALAGCASSTTSTSSPKETAISQSSDNGKNITINQGDTLKVTLTGNPSTGYVWERVSINQGFIVQQGDYLFTPDTNAVGSPGKFIFSFYAIDNGDEILKFVYRRPWEKDKAPAETFTANVKVK